MRAWRARQLRRTTQFCMHLVCTAAHNMVWEDIIQHIQKGKAQGWTVLPDTPMRKTILKTDKKCNNWQPNGIIYNSKTKTVHMLEFTRCNNSRHNDTTTQATVKKEIKYTELIDSIRQHNNQWTVELTTIAVGYLGTT
mmetsp:Transcript_7628/g.15110  ORF Transcript_7628/g.15110 Transcript_7628/m.15110 type:complete len:138 (-) Transcript_7628:143-556(-)